MKTQTYKNAKTIWADDSVKKITRIRELDTTDLYVQLEIGVHCLKTGLYKVIKWTTHRVTKHKENDALNYEQYFDYYDDSIRVAVWAKF